MKAECMKLIFLKNDLKRSFTVTRLMHGLVEKEEAACVRSD